MTFKGENGVSQAAIRRIARLREDRGYSSYELARRMSEAGVTITGQGITRKERGEVSTVTVDYVLAAAEALGVSLVSLLRPVVCERCYDEPPSGFACLECGMEGSP